MTVNDVTLIGKKILVGIVISAIPLLLIVGGLTLTRKLLADNDTQTKVSVVKP